MELAPKYRALLNEARRRHLPDLAGIGLCFQTLSLAAMIDRDCAALLAPQGLTEGRFVLLLLLDAYRDGLPPKALAEQAGVTRATVTGLLDGLERASLVERHADAQDRRSQRVRLTRQGKRVAGQVFTQHGRWIASLFDPLSPRERTQLAALLDKVAGPLASFGEGARP